MTNPDFPGQPENPKAAAKAAKAYAKASRPLYKKKRVLIPAALVVLGIAAAAGGGGDETDTTTASTSVESNEPASDVSAPAAVKVPAATKKAAPVAAAPAIKTTSKELIALLEGNALKAKNTYEDKRVTVTGFVGSIDASGDYFALDPEKDAIVFTGVQVRTSDKFKDQVADFTKGQAITVTGKITGVGEVLGYSLKAETIK